MSEFIDLLELLESGSLNDENKMKHIEDGKADFRRALLELLATAEEEDDFSN